MTHRFTSVLYLVLGACTPLLAQGPASTVPDFLSKAQADESGQKLVNQVSLTAAVEWTAGSLHEHGTAQLQANADGSAGLQFDLGQASWHETQTKMDMSRTCDWTDSSGKTHSSIGLNCLTAIPWFSPLLVTQIAIQQPSLFDIADGGQVSKDDVPLHQVELDFKLGGVDTTSAKALIKTPKFKVLYDPQMLLPASLEYAIHPDGDDTRSIQVRVVYSDFRLVVGSMVPFHIERYVNHSLQLSLDINNAVIN